jgi:hypothetical protein
MSKLVIENSIKTPSITLNNDGALEIKGKSIPENSVEFYKPVFDWLEAYLHAPSPQTELKISLEYFNTSTSKCLLDIFRKLETLNLSGKSKVKVLWYYETDDEDMMEAGEDYKALVKVPFELNKS